MSEPRQLLEGSTYLITRRTSERRFFLRPDAFVAQVFGYCMAYAARLFQVDIHFALALSNHYHAVVTDWRAKLPRFLERVHRLVAVAVNTFRGRWESLWSSSKPSVVRLETPDDVLDKILYLLANAVDAELVPRASEWPGLYTEPSRLLDPDGIEFERPSLYFDPAGHMPERVTLKLTKPPGFEDMTDAEFVELVQGRLIAQEEAKREEMEREGREFLGVDGVMAQHWNDSPDTFEPRRVRDPHIAAKDEEVRRNAIDRLCSFRADYRQALRRWTRGRRCTGFPAGTYAMRVRFGVRCHDPPPDLCWSPKAGDRAA